MTAQYPKLEEIVKPSYKLHVKKIYYMGSWRQGYYSVSFDEPNYINSKTVKDAFAAFRKAISAYKCRAEVRKKDDYIERYRGIGIVGFDWLIPYDILCYFEDWMQFTDHLQTLIQQADEHWKQLTQKQRERNNWTNLYFRPLRNELCEALRLFGLTSTATLEDVKSQYRTLAKQHHPDAGGDTEKFKQINKANQVLMEHFQVHSTLWK